MTILPATEIQYQLAERFLSLVIWRPTMKPTASLALLCLFATSAFAHFPWLSADTDGKVTYSFGENPAETNYKLPAPIAKAKVICIGEDGKLSQVELKKVETDEFVGMSSVGAVRAKMLMSKVTYGMHAGSRLDYYSFHQTGALPKNRKMYEQLEKGNSSKQALMPELQVQLVDTEKGVDAYVVWKGKPLAGADVTLFCEEGHEEGAATTDEQGKVSFSDKEVEDGLNGIMVGHQVKDDQGEFEGKPYSSSSHYLTMTFRDPQDFE